MVAEVTTITQHSQVGKETVPGTLVAATKQFGGLSWNLNPAFSQKTFQPDGFKYPTVQAMGKDSSTVKVSGFPTYDELTYIFAMVIKDTTPTGTTEKTWVFDPSSTAEDVPAILSVEEGSVARAHRAGYCMLTEFELSWSRDDIKLTASGFGQQLQDGVVLSPTPTMLPTIPLVPLQLDTYVDPTSGALGTTKLTRCISGSIKVSGRFGPLWVVNSANASYVAHVETDPKVDVKLFVEADAAGMALLTAARAATTQFLRFKATGATIGTLPYTAQLDVALKVEKPSEFKDSDGVYAVEFTGQGFHDATWGKAFSAKLVNTLVSL